VVESWLGRTDIMLVYRIQTKMSMRKLKVNDKMSAAIWVGCVGGLLSSE
jgi:hypothetical protein